MIFKSLRCSAGKLFLQKVGEKLRTSVAPGTQAREHEKDELTYSANVFPKQNKSLLSILINLYYDLLQNRVKSLIDKRVCSLQQPSSEAVRIKDNTTRSISQLFLSYADQKVNMNWRLTKMQELGPFKRYIKVPI